MAPGTREDGEQISQTRVRGATREEVTLVFPKQITSPLPCLARVSAAPSRSPLRTIPAQTNDDGHRKRLPALHHSTHETSLSRSPRQRPRRLHAMAEPLPASKIDHLKPTTKSWSRRGRGEGDEGAASAGLSCLPFELATAARDVHACILVCRSWEPAAAEVLWEWMTVSSDRMFMNMAFGSFCSSFWLGRGRERKAIRFLHFAKPGSWRVASVQCVRFIEKLSRLRGLQLSPRPFDDDVADEFIKLLFVHVLPMLNSVSPKIAALDLEEAAISSAAVLDLVQGHIPGAAIGSELRYWSPPLKTTRNTSTSRIKSNITVPAATFPHSFLYNEVSFKQRKLVAPSFVSDFVLFDTKPRAKRWLGACQCIKWESADSS
ncbi:hypothetical protein BDK51DRAFT_50804 [Blyttiomyces helicus]|uniref:Uncharacterized protein n=1 Tax=Blyttiomyces helicus TaxID=388810 RepID=A0A4P9W6W6_9FUNG|nr:hypothetical protein BDK51DRAFT_50804 [Blyttiomyces helicus]|eukprot:RKO88201.1 hypothetical protein BDK51DRAFT_50804 [Blyttiomyces helicus]